MSYFPLQKRKNRKPDFQKNRTKNQEQRLFSANWDLLLFQTSEFRLHSSYLRQLITDNRQQKIESGTKSKEQRLFSANWDLLVFSDLWIQTSYLRQLTTDNRQQKIESGTKSKEQRLCGANWNFLLFFILQSSYFIPPTSVIKLPAHPKFQ